MQNYAVKQHDIYITFNRERSHVSTMQLAIKLALFLFIGAECQIGHVLFNYYTVLLRNSSIFLLMTRGLHILVSLEHRTCACITIVLGFIMRLGLILIFQGSHVIPFQTSRVGHTTRNFLVSCRANQQTNFRKTHADLYKWG